MKKSIFLCGFNIKSGKLDGTQRSSDFKIMTGLNMGL